MGRLRTLLMLALSVSALVVISVPASASVPEASTAKFCKPLKGISKKLEAASSDTSKYSSSVFKKFAAALRASSKHAPGKVKKAGKTLASFYGAMGGGDPTAFAKVNSTKVSSAIGTYFGYVAVHCHT